MNVRGRRVNDSQWGGKVTQNTGIGIDSLQQLMTQFGGPLRQMGFDWQTSAAMLGQFQKGGVNTELVVGSLRIALGKMAKEGISDPSAALQTMITRIKDAGSAGQANAMALSMFGAKAGPDMAAAIREGKMDLGGLLQTLKNSPDTINKAAADTMTIAQKFSLMKQ
jgi:phage-related minor tail protein